jgi:hypothetical protein
MFSRFTQWLKEQRRWHKDHETAWAPVIAVGADGLTPFQHKCQAAFVKAIPGLAFEQGGEKERYLVAGLPGTASKVYIYENGSNIHEPKHDFIAEEWDFKTPDELIQAVVSEAARRVAI